MPGRYAHEPTAQETTIAIHHLFANRLTILAFASVALLTACSAGEDNLKPKTLPYVLKQTRELPADIQTVDLDGDGRDEIVHTYTPAHRPQGLQAVWIQTHDELTIEQVNFEGRLLPLHFEDLDVDGTPEILVPFVRNDSMFLSIVDSHGRKAAGFFLFSGSPRTEPEGTIPWDPVIRQIFPVDLDADGTRGLAVVAFTGYARYPRGVFVYRLPDGRLVGDALVAAGVGNGFLGDFDEDGEQELVLGSAAPNNGARQAGLDDGRSYFLVFELSPEPVLSRHIEIGAEMQTSIAYKDFDGDGRSEFLVMPTLSNTNADIRIIEPGTWRTLKQRSLAHPLLWASPMNLSRDPRSEIIIVSAKPRYVGRLDPQFNSLETQPLRGHVIQVEAHPDLNGDGLEEIVARTPSEVLLLGPDLAIQAVYRISELSRLHEPDYRFSGTLRQGSRMPPLLLLEDDGRTVALEMVANQFWWFFRYGPTSLWILGIASGIGLAFAGRRMWTQHRFMREVYPAAFDSATNGLLVLDANGRILLINATLCDWLGFDTPRRVDRARYDEALAWSPRLVSFLHEVVTRDSPRHHEQEVVLTRNDQEEAFQATAEPIALKGRLPCWLICLRRERNGTAYLDARTWAMMAKKVTHDIKNPLTNILLTAQRLQTEYRRRTPEEAEALDAFTNRIIDRVSTLRGMTKQFMKILDEEALDLVKTDLNGFVQDVFSTLARDLPPGIELTCTFQPDLPGVRVDREQMTTVLENLVSNAIHALPDGGTITLSTYSVSNLRSPKSSYEAADYLVLEVQDNGVGISEADRMQLFEPGFTTSEFGTGLGLVLVQVIVDQHGGFIEVESERQVGTIVGIHLPVAAS